ncbi:MAG: hypothetical protein QOD06_480 [Candidatus Binatota bacterium]|nr:hypothetical protein [Candidatus Binatota bacterium]
MSSPPEIPFHRPSIDDDDVRAVAEVLRSGWLTTGRRALAFEDAFAAYVGAAHAVAVSSGTAALHLALLAAGVGPGDAVLTSPFTFPATAEAALYCGAEPVFADVDSETLNLDPDRAAEVLDRERGRRRFRAIVPVHYGGQPCAMEELLPLAERHGLRVVEDAAHALPAWRRMPGEGVPHHGDHLAPPPAGECWRTVGAIGDFTAFSFYATKPITTGEGGMITCADGDTAELLRSLRLHGLSRDAWKRYTSEGTWRYDVERTGYKYNLPDVLAALGVEQLKRSDALAAERRQLAALYGEALAPYREHVRVPRAEERAGHAWHLYPVRLRTGALRDRAVAGLRERGIGTSVHFIPLHLHSYYADRYGTRRGDFPAAEAAFDTVLSLPLYPGLGESGVARVVEALADVVRGR